MRRSLLCGALGVLAFLVSCETNSIDKPEQKEINRLNTLELMKKYFPYQADATYDFINDQTGNVWSITPSVNSSDLHEFPAVESYEYKGARGLEWENTINAEFIVGGLGNVNPTVILFNVSTSGTGFEIHLQTKIPLSQSEAYGTSLSQMECDSVEFYNIFTDTIIMPITKEYDARGRSSRYDMPDAYVKMVRGVGLTDFSIDGKTVYRRK